MAVRTPAVTVAGSALLQSVAGAGELLRRHNKNLQVLRPTNNLANKLWQPKLNFPLRK